MLLATRISRVGPRRSPAAIRIVAQATRRPANPAKVHYVLAYSRNIADER